MRSDQKRLFTLCFAGLLVAHLYLILTTRLYPFIDLPNHLVEATLYRYYGSPTNQFSTYYSVDPGMKPNTFHTYFCAIPFLPSVEFGNRLLLAMYVLSVPLSTLLIIRKIGGNQWFSLFSFVLLYNYSVSWGFMGFMLGLPLVLLFFSLLLSVWKEGDRLRGLAASILLVVLFFMHALSALFALLVLAAGSAYAFRGNVKKWVGTLLIGLPVTILIAHWWFFERADAGPDTLTYLSDYFLDSFYPSLPLKVPGLMAFDNYSLLPGLWGTGLAALFTVGMMSPMLMWLIKRKDRPLPAGMGFPGILFVCSIACYFALPDKLPGEHYIFPRFAVLTLSSITLASSLLYAKATSRNLALAIAAISVLHLVLWFQYFRQFDHENAGFTPDVFPERQQDRRLAGLISDLDFRGRPIYNHFSDYDIVWKQGLAVTGITNSRFGFVRATAGPELLPNSIDWLGRFEKYDGRFRDMDFLLVRGDLPADSSGGLARFHLVKRSGKWKLFGR